MNSTQAAASTHIDGFSFSHLPAFVHFIKENHLSKYVQEYIKLVRQYQLPILRFFEEYTDEQIQEITKAGVVELFNAISDNDVKGYFEKSREMLRKNMLPYAIDRKDISAYDMTMVSYIRKTVFTAFIRQYTSDIELANTLHMELDNLFVQQRLFHERIMAEVFREKIQQDEEAREREHHFELLADAIPQMVWIADKDGKVTYFNRQWMNFTGMPPEAAREEWVLLLHKDDVAKTKLLWQQSIASGDAFEAEYRLRNREGEFRWYLARALPVRDDDNNISQWFGTCTDIHEQKLAEHSLVLQARVLESMEEGVSICDEDGIILFTNSAEDRMFGYEQGELTGQHVTVQNAYDAQQNERMVNAVIQTLKERGQWTGEWHNKRKDGTTFFTFSHITALRSGTGNLFVCVQRDITEEKRAQQALTESEERFRSLADNAPMFVWVADEMANLVYYNKTLGEYVGDTEAFLQQGWATITHPDDLSNVFAIYSDAMADPKPFSVEARLKGANGSYHWFVFKGVPRFEDDHFVGFIGTALDIEEQKKLTQELEERVSKRTRDLVEINHKLERSNEELEQFAYVASHDLQEPLRKISAFGNILVTRYKPVIGDEGADLIGRMQSASERMRVLIEELLTYSRVSRQVDKKPIDLSEILKEVMTDMETTIRDKQASIEVEDLGTINGNPMQIRQLFQNLLSNSLKFSKPEEPPVISLTSKKLTGKETGLTVISGDEDKEFLLITVKDNGIGFEQQYAEKIFQVFQRLHGRTEYAGSGVGLSIVQKVIEHHKGYVTAEGTPGEGASFKILLPALEP